MTATPVRREPSSTAGVFTREDAELAGWSDAAVRHAVDSGRWRRLKAGAYTSTDAGPLAEVYRLGVATQLLCARAVVSHGAAAVAHGLPVVGPVQACVTVPAGTPMRTLSRVHLHRAALPKDHLQDREGVLMTSVARTVLDLARHFGVDSGVSAADAALRAGLTSNTELESVLAVCQGWPGRAAAAATVLAADAGAESPLESLSRLRLVRAGIPMPTLQARIADQRGVFVARTDFYWPEFGVVGEADGNLKYDAGRGAIVAERRREAALRDLGLEVVRWEWSDLARFDVVVRRLGKAFERGGPRTSRNWRVLAS